MSDLLIFDAHLDLSLNAIEWNRDLTQPLEAIRQREAHLRDKFGDAYDAYVEKRGAPMTRRFSLERAIRNREHHTLAGLLAGFAVLAAKIAARQ